MRMRRAIVVGAVLLLGCPSEGPAASSGSDTTVVDTSTSSGPVADDTATGSGSSSGSSSGSTASAEDTEAAPPGEIDVLTYNVAGLPQGISSSNPEVNIPQISPRLDAFGLVLVQEDFWYHAELAADVTLPYQSEPWTDMPSLGDMGDGLNRFGLHPFADHERVAWYDCHGTIDCASDCLATKGWSFARHTLAEGVELDVYNLHGEAGSCPEDFEIRLHAAQDLVDGIAARSGDRAVLVAGDFNLRATDPEDQEPLGIIMEGAGLTDACTAVACGDERIDKVMIRGSATLQLEVLEWWIPEGFVDEAGEPLSDHLPVAVRVRYQPG
jgi:hypothetical protein